MRNRDLRPGKKVVVYRKLTGQAGWKNSWFDVMDEFIGTEQEVESVTVEDGVHFKDEIWFFPSGALMSVKQYNARKS